MAKLKQIVKIHLAKVSAIESSGNLPKISDTLGSILDSLPEGPDLPTLGEGEGAPQTTFTFVKGYDIIVPAEAPRIKEVRWTPE